MSFYEGFISWSQPESSYLINTGFLHNDFGRRKMLSSCQGSSYGQADTLTHIAFVTGPEKTSAYSATSKHLTICSFCPGSCLLASQNAYKNMVHQAWAAGGRFRFLNLRGLKPSASQGYLAGPCEGCQSQRAPGFRGGRCFQQPGTLWDQTSNSPAHLLSFLSQLIFPKHQTGAFRFSNGGQNLRSLWPLGQA